MTTRTKPRTWLEELDGRTCAELLAVSWMGRLAVMVDDHPEVFPVNHAFDPVTGDIAFPSRAGTKLHAALHAPWVAFEVDGVDGDDGSGWSVLVIGRAEEITDHHTIERMTRLRHERWALSDQSRWLCIRASRVTGRRISERTD